MSTMNGITLFDKKAFEATHNGKPISIYTLDSGNGVVMQVTNYGGRVVSLWVPDRDGKHEDIVLGYNCIDKYLNNPGERYLGAMCGRYANRIADGQFEMDGTKYQLPINNGPNCLHGGPKGFDVQVWDVEKATNNELCLSYTAADGEEGFPGELKVRMVYMLTPHNEFKITYEAVTDKATHINLTHHSYFNLKGEGNGTAMDHQMMINAHQYIPINHVGIPLGEIAAVENTPFDFRKSRAIADHINEKNEQLEHGAGYDHCWVVDKKTIDEVALAATVYEPTSGRVMDVLTDQPGIQFYSAYYFDGKTKGKYGKTLNSRESIALETQKYPNSPNEPNFPSTRLNLGEMYKHVCIYKFGVK